MFLLPITQDIEIWGEEKRVDKNVGDYIYLEKDGQILKFKVSIPHLDITSCLESYINHLPVCEFDIMKESHVKAFKWPLKLVKCIGNFKLEGEHFKTRNYLVPNATELSSFLCQEYRKNHINVPFNTDDLKVLNQVNEIYLAEGNSFELDIIDILKSNIEVELEEVYDIDLNQLELYIKNIEKMLGNDESSKTLTKLRNILISSKKNKTYIEELGLQEKFDQAMNKNNQKVK